MSKQFSAGLLQVARQTRGLSQKDLAERTGLTQGYLSKVEHSLLQPSEDAVAALSRALGYPASFFYQNDQIVGLPVSVHPMFRKRASVGKRALDMLQGHLNVRLLHVRRLLLAVEHTKVLELPMLDLEAIGSPEDVADLVRRTWLVPSGPIGDLTAYIERAGCLVLMCNFDDALVDGVTIRLPDLPPCIFLNATLSGDRQRFTLAHELGHLVMHRIPSQSMEDEANQFAAAFLMPKRDLAEYVHGARVDIPILGRLKPFWRVSMSALLMRLTKIDAVPRSQADYIWRRMSSLGYRTREPPELDIERERPSVVPRILSIHLEKLGYSLGELGAALHLDEEELVTLYNLTSGKRPRMQIVK